MRDDQYAKLKTLSDRLIDAAIFAADPANWTGGDIKPGDMTRDQRGDAYWCRKLAASTLVVYTKVEHLIGFAEDRERARRGSSNDTPPPETEGEDLGLEAEMVSAEREAAAILDRITKRSRKG